MPLDGLNMPLRLLQGLLAQLACIPSQRRLVLVPNPSCTGRYVGPYIENVSARQ